MPIHGTAKLVHGEPFDGMITFVPDAGNAGPSASATLKNGVYEFTTQNGPVAGPHRVTVIKIIPKSQLLRDKDKPRGKKSPPGSTEPPPAEPKMEWPFVISVPDSGNLQCDFDLE